MVLSKVAGMKSVPTARGVVNLWHKGERVIHQSSVQRNAVGNGGRITRVSLLRMHGIQLHAPGAIRYLKVTVTATGSIVPMAVSLIIASIILSKAILKRQVMDREP